MRSGVRYIHVGDGVKGEGGKAKSMGKKRESRVKTCSQNDKVVKDHLVTQTRTQRKHP